MMAMVRVLFVSNVGVIGGAEESLLAMLRGFNRQRVEAVVACPAGPLAERAMIEGAKYYAIPTLRYRRGASVFAKAAYAMRVWRTMRRLRRIIRDEWIQLVHSNSSQAHLAGGWAAEGLKVPAIWHERDLRPLRRVVGRLARQATRIIAISEAVAKNLRGQGVPADKISVIYNGIDAEEFVKRARSLPNEFAGGKNRLVAMAAQMAPWKRHEDFIRAMALVHKEAPEAVGLIAGGDLFGEHEDYRRQMEKLVVECGATGAVAFLGQYEKLPALIWVCDALVVPSDAEPFGRVALEAMAQGKPVVGTRAGGLPELVVDGETGLLVTPLKPEELAKAIVRVLKDRELAKRLGEAGAKRAREKFGIGGTVRGVEGVYGELVN
jgi:L-malate glycosyltransferase